MFLYGFDPGPDWRGEPFNIVIGKWMWGWHYGIEEAAGRLEEHGYFQVVEYKRVWWDEEKEQKIAQEMEAVREADHRRKMAEDPGQFLPYLPAMLERPPYAYVIVARRVERP